MKKILEFICLMGIIFPIMFFLIYPRDKKEKPAHHFGEAYADIPKSLPPVYQPTKITEPIQEPAKTVEHQVRKKPPIIPGTSKLKRKNLSSNGKKKTLFKMSFGDFIAERCIIEGLDTAIHLNILISLAGQESNWNPYKKNPTSSARGFYQLLNSTGIMMCVELGISPEMYDPYNPYQNIMLGVHLYAKNYKKFKSVKWAVSSHYNGSGAAREVAEYFGGVDKDPFVSSVMGIVDTPYKKPSQEAIEKWKYFLMYKCHECKDYIDSLLVFSN